MPISHIEFVEERTMWRTHWLARYGLAVLTFAAVIGLSFALRYFEARVNLTIPVVLGIVLAALHAFPSTSSESL